MQLSLCSAAPEHRACIGVWSISSNTLLRTTDFPCPSRNQLCIASWLERFHIYFSFMLKFCITWVCVVLAHAVRVSCNFISVSALLHLQNSGLGIDYKILRWGETTLIRLILYFWGPSSSSSWMKKACIWFLVFTFFFRYISVPNLKQHCDFTDSSLEQKKVVLSYFLLLIFFYF